MIAKLTSFSAQGAIVTGLLVAFTAKAAGDGDAIEFNRQIRPILAAKCFQCHGPDETARQADLRLDVDNDEFSPFAGESESAVIVRGKPTESELWRRVTSDDEFELMPPPDSEKEPLTASELSLLEQWINEGAHYQRHWSFEPLKVQDVPTVANATWPRNRTDQFVLHRLERERIAPSKVASKRALIRRLTLDLTGLPPTLDEIDRFLADDSPDAYDRLVDELISRPQFGEHMARYWLDVVRFADTNGIHHDHYREMTPYRDWVIRAFNGDMPFDKFIVDQIAGDLHDNPTTNQLIASGFNRLHLVIDRGTAIPEESFTRNVVDRVSAVGTAFMGLTVGCAVCHDHKYDPITQRDFYQLYAFFNNIDAAPETPGKDVHEPFIRLPGPEQKSELELLEAKIDEASANVKLLEQAQLNSTQAADQVEGEFPSTDTESLSKAESRLKQLEEAKKQLVDQIPVSLIMRERSEVRPTHMLVRGAYDRPGESVERNTPSFLPPLESDSDVKSRMDLAKWLVDPDHPLTARVTVNRFWQQFFGVGLVRTSEDLGTQGEWPSHPALLDDLAVEFIQSGWDVKRLVKRIVTSETYRQSSTAEPASFRKDPANRLLSRGSRFRLDAEMIRDQILFVSGLLSRKMYGKSVKPPQPPDLWKNVSMVSSSTYAFEADEGESIHRRSLYSFWKRALPPPQMTIFDAPTRESCTARRERTNTPLQALVLMNEQQYFIAAKQFANRLLKNEKLEDDERIAVAYESVTSQKPDEAEMDQLLQALEELQRLYANDPDSAKALSQADLDDDQNIRLAAMTMLVNSLFNLDIAKTRE